MAAGPARLIAIYPRLLRAYRVSPGVHTVAAKAAACSYRAAKGLWENGVPGYPDMPAIQSVLEAEGAVASSIRKTQAAALAPGVPEAAIEDGVKLRVDLQNMALGARKLSLASVALVAAELSAVQPLSAVLKKQIDQAILNPWIPVKRNAKGRVTEERLFTAEDAVRLQGRVLANVGAIVKASYTVLQLERLHHGLPTDILGVETMSLEEAVREIETGYAELQQAKESGLVLIQGGKP